MPELRRPDPDALLALIKAEERGEERTRGHLKIFFGATAGVGKTYAMLQAAQERRRSGTDVVVGLVETHRRSETEALLAGLEILPRLRLAYGGVTLEEFDVDGALTRHPQLLLVDELAHTNATGARHAKRWQDVDELLGTGIDVYTTLNVQHIESLNDVVSRVTGVRVRETVPDSILEQADEVELIDLPPEELLERLREGKVYMPEQAERALEKFFRKGNLIALRQMALLRTADRVDRQMEVYRRAHAAAETWPVRDRLLVGVGPSPSSEQLIRGTKRMADRLGAEWMAVYVETPSAEHWAQSDRDRVWRSLQLAEELGAKTVSLSGDAAAAEILSYARSHNVTKIVVGKPTHATWKDVIGLSFNDRIVRGSGAIDVYVITGETEEPAPARGTALRTATRVGWRAYGAMLLAVAAATAVAALMYPRFERTNLVMVYLLGIVLVAMRLGRRPAILMAILSVATFDFFFVPPHFTFAVSDTQYLVTFGVMLAVGAVIGTLTARLRAQGEAARAREWRTAFLYDMSRELVHTADSRSMLRLTVPRIADAFDAEIDVFLPDEKGGLRAWAEGGETESLDPSEHGIVEWVRLNRRPAGMGTDTFATRPGLYLPLAARDRSFGVLRVKPGDPERLRAPEQLHLVELVANQLAAAMERASLAEERRRARQLEEMDRLKTEFVAVASRELRTPVRSLAGQIERVRHETSTVAARQDIGGLLDAAEANVERLRLLVDELLDLSRLEAGQMALELQPVNPAELLRPLGDRFRERAEAADMELTVEVPDDLPPVSADARRIEGVLAALVDNALRYGGAGRHVIVSADEVGRFVQFSVADDGPGIPVDQQSRIFDKFVRLGGTEGPEGTGLGLAVAREVVRTHRGAIWVDSGPGPGSVFSFTLPVARKEQRSPA